MFGAAGRLVLVALLVSACGAVSDRVVAGSGDVATETRALEGVTGVILETVGNGHIVVGPEEGIVIEAESNLLPLITTRVEEGILRIGVENRTEIRPTKLIRYTITVDRVDSVVLAGAGMLEVTDTTNDELDVELPGSGTIAVSGQVQRLQLEISGAGNVDTAALAADDVTVELTGSGNAVVWARATLSATVSGVGIVSYWGEPVLSEDVSGVGQVVRLGAFG
jgi:hypothetical protein